MNQHFIEVPDFKDITIEEDCTDKFICSELQWRFSEPFSENKFVNLTPDNKKWLEFNSLNWLPNTVPIRRNCKFDFNYSSFKQELIYKYVKANDSVDAHHIALERANQMLVEQHSQFSNCLNKLDKLIGELKFKLLERFNNFEHIANNDFRFLGLSNIEYKRCFARPIDYNLIDPDAKAFLMWIKFDKPFFYMGDVGVCFGIIEFASDAFYCF